MEHEMFAIMPVIHQRVEIEQQAVIQPQETPSPHTLEEVRAVDAAFTGNDDLTDRAIGLMGLTLGAPWLIDVLADHLRPSPQEEEEEPKPRLDNGEED